jgi:hypothetical protein
VALPPSPVVIKPVFKKLLRDPVMTGEWIAGAGTCIHSPGSVTLCRLHPFGTHQQEPLLAYPDHPPPASKPAGGNQGKEGFSLVSPGPVPPLSVGPWGAARGPGRDSKNQRGFLWPRCRGPAFLIKFPGCGPSLSK